MTINIKNTKTNKIHRVLHCLYCNKQFRFVSSNKIICQNSHEFSIDEEVLILETKIKLPKKFVWGKKLRNPKENLLLDETQSTLAKPKSKLRMEKMISFIVNNLTKNNTTILDIATGRGLLIRNLLPATENSVIYLTDLDTDVLVGTNKLIQTLNGKNTIVPITSSATHLPFNNNSIPIVVCFGINNVRKTREALIEIWRILKPEGKLIFSFSLMDQNSPSFDWLQTQNDKPNSFDVIDKWQMEAKNMGFTIFKQEILFDGPVEKAELDLIPRENGERFQDVGVVLIKKST